MSGDELLPNVWAGFRAEMEDCPDFYWDEDSPHPASARAVAAMFLAARTRVETHGREIPNITGSTPPRWTTNVSWLDTVLAGGFYGLTCLAGFPGLGKSTMALASAIEAAASLEWNVVYFEAEMGDDILAPRLEQYLSAHPSAEDAINHMRIVSVAPGFRIEDLLEHCVTVAGDDRPLLCAIDSINTVAQLMPGNYLDNLRALNLFCMGARRKSRGAASFLTVSELNRSGGAKGMSIEHWADVVVKLLGEKEKGWVRMKLQKTRATQGEQEERKMVRVYHSSRFYTRDELESQRQQASMGAGTGYLSAVPDDDDDEPIF